MKVSKKKSYNIVLKDFFLKRWSMLVFIIIVCIGIYLRFYRIESIFSFGWDQARDAWTVRDILAGKLILIGPKTGIGHFHLGPIYYYFLAPFFYFIKLDPMASNYFNILANIFNFLALYYVATKFFKKSSALFIVFIYAINAYIVLLNRIPWNVTLVPGISVIIFYSLHKVYVGDFKWLLVAMGLSGFFFNFHLSAVFFPPIIFLALIFVPKKRKLLPWILCGLPLYFMWFIPNIISELTVKTGDYFRLRDFYGWYVMDFHLRFFFHRLPDSLIQLAAVLHFPILEKARYLVIAAFMIVGFFYEKAREKKYFSFLIMLWFVIPLIGFTIYSGPISDYYFLLNLPTSLFVIAYLQEKMLNWNYRVAVVLLVIFWSYYTWVNVLKTLPKPEFGGLQEQKQDVDTYLQRGEKIFYNEGDIKSYLYEIRSQKAL